MSRPNASQLKWLEELTGMGGGTVRKLAVEPAAAADPGLVASTMGGQGVVLADAAEGTLSVAGGKGAPKAFVPELEIVGGSSKRELAVAGKLTLELNVRNWAKRPNGTKLDWTITGGGKVVEFEFDRLDDGGLLTVTGVGVGTGVVKMEVTIVGGRTHKFPEAVFTVYPSAKNASMFVPHLAAPRTLSREIAVKDKVTVQLKVTNWDKRPKGTRLVWGATSSPTLDVDLEHKEGQGDGTITVTALSPGTARIKADVKVEGGGTYPFHEIQFTVINDPDPNRSADQGGPADDTNLEQDMRNILQDWHNAAYAGIGQFVTNELSKRIDKLESGSAKSFLTSLLGNLVWAAACFTTGGAAFAISVVGIGIGAVPAIPEKSKSFIPTVQKAMEDYIDSLFDQWDHSLRNKAKELLKQYQDISRFHALNEFMSASFQPAYFKLNSGYTTIPILNKAAIRDLYEKEATEKLDEAIKADEAEKRRRAAEAKKDDWLPKGGPGRF